MSFFADMLDVLLSKMNPNHGWHGRFVSAPETGGGGSSTRYERYHVPDTTAKWLGFEGKLSLAVDLAALLHRHPECFASEVAVRNSISRVLEKPDDWWPHAAGRVMVFRYGNDGSPALRIEVEGRRGNMRVSSIYIMSKASIAAKLDAKKRWIEDRRRTGASPASPTVAEFLRERVGLPVAPHDAMRRSSLTSIAPNAPKVKKMSAFSRALDAILKDDPGSADVHIDTRAVQFCSSHLVCEGVIWV